MRMKVMLVAFIVVIVFFSSSLQTTRATDGPAKEYDDAEAYKIYSTILPSEWPIRIVHAKHVLIRRETRVNQMCLRPEGEFEKTVGPAIKDYLRVNASPWLLQQKFDTELSYELISNAQLTSVLGNNQWERFHEYYPESKGWLEFSAVGFNSERTIAVLYMGHHCGLLCGGGSFHVLQKKNDEWAPMEWKGSSCAWVS